MKPQSRRARTGVAAAVLAGILAGLLARWLWRRSLPARTLIVSARESTVIAADGAVRSVQAAHVALAPADLDRIWKQANLENLARTYWLFLSRVTLGAIRVIYGAEERRVVLLVRPLTLLRFSAPEYAVEPNHGKVTWHIRDGLLVARAGRNGSGFLSLDVRRQDAPADAAELATLHVAVEVANFYPAIAAGLSTVIYEATQSFVHVLVTHAFLRSLAKLELAESKVRKLPAE
ncbi:MAG: hypothetical protein ACLP8S_32750 [Solirubrobacteraceae bacterium]